VAKTGDRFAALQPVYDAVIDRWGHLDADIARGLSLRHDWGPQYRSAHFLGSIGWLGIADDAAFLGEPETNGCAERWIRTLKEQCLWAELHDTVDQLRRAVTSFVDTYNTQWLIQRHATAPQRRPTRTPPRPLQRDQIDVEAVQPTGRCSDPAWTTIAGQAEQSCCIAARTW
jgi:transposase InsO family protein